LNLDRLGLRQRGGTEAEACKRFQSICSISHENEVLKRIVCRIGRRDYAR
jgi:hypothetical protein